MGILERIRAKKLQKDQARIAEIITCNLHKVAFLSGPELAKECSVSVSAITRFAQKIGYKGFPQLKSALEQLYREQTTPYEMFENFIDAPGKEPVWHQSFTQDLQNIESMKVNLDIEAFDCAVEKLQNAKKIHLTAIASSEILVDYFYDFLLTLKKEVNCLKSIGITKIAEVTEFKSDHVLVGFSFQRILREVRDVFRYVKPFGVTCIAVTDSPFNALAVESDIVLIAPVIGTTFGLSHAAPLAMINAMVNQLAAFDKKQSLQALKQAKNVWENFAIFCEARQGKE